VRWGYDRAVLRTTGWPRAPTRSGAPDGESLSTRITLPGHTGLLALRH